MKNVYVFGNPDLEMDSLPIQMIPEMQRLFPEETFLVLDPNEDWGNLPNPMVIIDTVVGIKEPRLFDSLTGFEAPPKCSTHDFDAYENLRFLKKLGKLNEVKILGIPAGIEKGEALNFVGKTLQGCFK